MALIIIVDQVINKTGMVDSSEEGFQRVLDNTDVFVILPPFPFSSVQLVILITKKMKRIYRQC